MAHRKFEFEMPAAVAVVFDAFHYHCWRCRWDSLVANTRVFGGGECPYLGAITENQGRAYLRPLAMRTQFVSYQRPNVAAAQMIGKTFPFTRWAASIRHRPLSSNRSLLLYTHTFEAGNKWTRWLVEPITQRIFDTQTQRRFTRLQLFLSKHADEIVNWQKQP